MTPTGNTTTGATKAYGGLRYVTPVVNVISSGNSPDSNYGGDCTNSCLVGLKDPSSQDGVIKIDPRLDANFYPHARVCKNTGVTFDWMTDADDVRSKDLAGKPRIIGEKPDMGAFECLPIGFMLLFR